MLEDLHATRQRIASSQGSAALEMDRCIVAARSPACGHVFLKTMFDEARVAAGDAANAQRPLAGLAVYNATKAGAEALAFACRQEVAHHW